MPNTLDFMTYNDEIAKTCHRFSIITKIRRRKLIRDLRKKLYNTINLNEFTAYHINDFAMLFESAKQCIGVKDKDLYTEDVNITTLHGGKDVASMIHIKIGENIYTFFSILELQRKYIMVDCSHIFKNDNGTISHSYTNKMEYDSITKFTKPNNDSVVDRDTRYIFDGNLYSLLKNAFISITEVILDKMKEVYAK